MTAVGPAGPAPAAHSAHGLGMRSRLTLMTTVIFAILGCGLLALNWLSARQLLANNRTLFVPATKPLAPGTTADPHPSAVASGAAAQYERFQHTILTDLFTRSAVLLVSFTAIAALLAWWSSRRSLRRLGQVTATARRIGTGTSLDRRLALDGPRDEIRELGDTFDAMLDRLERSFADQRRFTAHASHELRTPLTLQRTALEIPLAQGRVPAELQPAFRQALDANARSERLLAALLALARGESGLVSPRPADLLETARTAIADLRTEAEAAGIDVASDVQPAPVAGDPSLLNQVAVNLIANAVRHNHRGGHLRVTTGITETGSFIEVVNSGPPVGADELAALFEPFRRGDVRHGGGVGLGLAVVRAIAASHHGVVEARPRPGGGLRVRVVLPVRDNDEG